DEVPDDFVFTLKAPRSATNRRELAAAGDSIARFVDSGIAELGPKLGPLLWQLMPARRFNARELAAFLALLPRSADGRTGPALRHALEARHASFRCAEALAIAREHGVTLVFTDSPKYPSFADVTGSFIYARLMKAEARRADGYAPQALEAWADVARAWVSGAQPAALPCVEAPRARVEARDVFILFIGGGHGEAPPPAP